MSLSIIIPWQNKGGDARYEQAAQYVIDHYRSLNIGEVIVGTYPVDDQPLNRSRLRNDGASRATGDVLAFIDAEILVPTKQLLEAERLAREAPGSVFPLSYGWTYITPQETEQIYAGVPFENFVRTPPHQCYYQFGRDYVSRHWMVSPASVISREGFDIIGGWDEDFVGWGEEDRIYNWRAQHLLGPLRTVDGGFVHINHTDEEAKVDNMVHFTEGTEERRLFLANVARFQKKALEVYTPKIAVYTVAKDAAEDIERWAASAGEADLISLLDVGSTDDTVRLAKAAGAEVFVEAIPSGRADDLWNASLDSLPDGIDICVPLRTDERLQPGWRAAVTDAWLQGADQFLCRYRWPSGATEVLGRVHVPKEWRWQNPVREALVGKGVTLQCNAEILRRGTQTEDPGALRLLLAENPGDQHVLYAYGSHLYREGEWVEAREVLVRYLAVGNIDQERSEACLMISEMVFDRDREVWLLRAASECPLRREPWERLADYYLMHRMADEARGAASRLLRIKWVPQRNDAYQSPQAWNDEYIRKTYIEQVEPDALIVPPDALVVAADA